MRTAEHAISPYRVVRPVILGVLAVTIGGYALAIHTGQIVSVVVGLALIVAAGVVVLDLRGVVKLLCRQSTDVRSSAIEAEQHYVSVLRRVVKIVEAREQYGEGHSERIGRLSKEIGAELGLDSKRCELLGLAGELHDIGLLAIPDGILSKHGRLGVDEFRQVQKHSQVSYDILKPLESLSEVLSAVRYHHERMNGTGYPEGIAGDEIPVEARILAVADAYDAMTHDRPHRPAMSSMMAVRELVRCTPSGYDEQCVRALAEILNAPDIERIVASVGEPAASGA